ALDDARELLDALRHLIGTAVGILVAVHRFWLVRALVLRHWDTVAIWIGIGTTVWVDARDVRTLVGGKGNPILVRIQIRATVGQSSGLLRAFVHVVEHTVAVTIRN